MPTNIYCHGGRSLATLFLVAGLSHSLVIAQTTTDSATLPPRAAPGSSQYGAVVGRVQNAVTEQFLSNAQISIKGTDIVGATDASGTYRLARIPAGPVVVVFFYTGLDPQEAALVVVPGSTVEQNARLTNISRYGTSSGIQKLDPYVVANSRQTDAKEIAINEQRFAPNIKNVVTGETYGDVVDGNVAEFIKFLPGVMGDFDTDEAASTTATISIRGFASNLTGVSSDGMQSANTSNATGTSRSFSFGQVSMNNISRIEVTKVPLPSTAADSIAGSINMVSKSAFERKTAQLLYRVSLTADSNALNLGRDAFPNEKRVYKIRPGFDFDYTLPITKDFGIVVTGLSSDRYIDQYSSQMIYNAAGTSTGATLAKPFLQSYRLADTPRFTSRSSAGLRIDWRPSPNSVLSFIGQYGKYESDKTANLWLLSAGTVGTATPATGTPLSFGPDSTTGATGRGALTTSTAAAAANPLTTVGEQLKYRFDNGDWKVESAIGSSRSAGGYRDTADGHFRQFGLTNKAPVRVSFANIDDIKPNTIHVFDNADKEVNIYDIANYALTTANSTPRSLADEFKAANLDVSKAISGMPFPLTLQVGGAARRQTRDTRLQSITWNYNGPGGDTSAAPYLTTVYANQDDHFGFKNLPWLSHYKAWQAFQANPALFTQTPAQVVAQENYRVTNSAWVAEDVGAGYLQAQMRLFQNRLTLVTGVRHEGTHVQGQGVLFDPNAVYQRDSKGNYLHGADGKMVRKAEAGAVGSMQELVLIRKERAYIGDTRYSGYYPSLHLTFALKDNLLLRAAYAKTYGRPDFTEIVPNATVNEADIVANPSQTPGTITLNNTHLRPWSANNFDLSAEYYTKQGGILSAGLFMKKIKNFFSTINEIATPEDLQQVGLDPQYLGWKLSTEVNGGDAEVDGAEVNFSQSFQTFGGLWRYFEVFANGTLLNLKGDRDADFNNFVPRSASWGVTFRMKPIMLMARWNYRGQQRRVAFPALGPDAYDYQGGRTMLDLSLNYQLARNLGFFASAQNVFQAPLIDYRYGSQTPDYAKRPYLVTGNGVQFTAGIKGSF